MFILKETYRIRTHTDFVYGDKLSISGVKISFREIVESSDLKNKFKNIKKSFIQEPVIETVELLSRAGEEAALA